jgi:hypothetical protein
MKKRWLGLLAPLAALPIALGSGAGAATGWKTIGLGNATARGPQPAAFVTVASTTRPHPVEVRITLIDGDFSGRTHIVWNIVGFNQETGTMRVYSGRGDYSLPKTVTQSLPSWVDYASVYVHAGSIEPPDAFQLVRVAMQARY